jgi:hypothetical protein
MENVQEIKIKPETVKKIQALAERCEMAPSAENVQFLFEYLIRSALGQIEMFEDFSKLEIKKFKQPVTN